MKQLLLTAAASMSLCAASAAITSPGSFLADFRVDRTFPSQWPMYGVEGVPTGEYASLFTDYSTTNSYTRLSLGNDMGIFSPSEFETVTPSDQWVITPEFEVGTDSELLTFTVYVAGNTIKNNYSVYYSTGGIAKEDFTANKLLSTSLKGKGSSVNTVGRRVEIKGLKGQKIRLALVNNNNQTGLVGFGDISVAPYYMSIQNPEFYDNIVLDGNGGSIDLKMRVSTPDKANGIKAKLTSESGFETTAEYVGAISSGMFTTVTLKFDGIDFKGMRDMDYTIEVSIDGYDAAPTYVTGKLINAPREYRMVMLAEECTGTWCGNCPIGLGFVHYYADKYDGKDDSPWFIPTAVHYNDPMQAPMDYLTGLESMSLKVMPQFGLPNLLVNRSAIGHPVALDVDAVAAGKAYGQTVLRRVSYDKASGDMAVSFDSRITFSIGNAPINAAVIVAEDGVTGRGSQWSQSDYIGGVTEEQVVEQIGEHMVPYLKHYLNRPDNVVPDTDMVYDEVVRGIYPSFGGSPLEGAWTAGTFRNDELTFKMPESIMDPEKSFVILALINSSNGEVISADRVMAADYNKELSGVDDVTSDGAGVSVRMEGESAVIDSAEAGVVEVYGVDGSLRTRVEIEAGRNVVGLPEGLAIVRVITVAGSASFKMNR